MRLRLYFIIILATTLNFASVRADDPEFVLGLYVVVDDIQESREFYEKLFQSPPSIDTGEFVGFNISNSLFSLFSKESYTHVLSKGNNVVPYIRVRNIESEFHRVKEFAVTMVHENIVEEGPVKLFMFTDPSGNPIEFYSW